jgi:hypothetical protein
MKRRKHPTTRRLIPCGSQHALGFSRSFLLRVAQATGWLARSSWREPWHMCAGFTTPSHGRRFSLCRLHSARRSCKRGAYTPGRPCASAVGAPKQWSLASLSGSTGRPRRHAQDCPEPSTTVCGIGSDHACDAHGVGSRGEAMLGCVDQLASAGSARARIGRCPCLGSFVRNQGVTRRLPPREELPGAPVGQRRCLAQGLLSPRSPCPWTPGLSRNRCAKGARIAV